MQNPSGAGDYPTAASEEPEDAVGPRQTTAALAAVAMSDQEEFPQTRARWAVVGMAGAVTAAVASVVPVEEVREVGAAREEAVLQSAAAAGLEPAVSWWAPVVASAAAGGRPAARRLAEA